MDLHHNGQRSGADSSQIECTFFHFCYTLTACLCYIELDTVCISSSIGIFVPQIQVGYNCRA